MVSRRSLCGDGCLFRVLQCRDRSDFGCSVPGEGNLRPETHMKDTGYCGDTLAALSLPSLLMGLHWSWGGASVQPPPLPPAGRRKELA